MATKKIQLQDPAGKYVCAVETFEGDSLVSQGKAIRVTKRLFRLLWPPPAPSKSADTACSLTMGDMMMLAGLLPMNEFEQERLAGYGITSKLSEAE